jgi:hypothetical protein
METDVPTRWPSAYNMLDRAVYLRSAIGSYLDQSPNGDRYKLTDSEWEQAIFLRDILLPFKACNDRIEARTRVGIDKVFPTYEVLFNELDRLSDILRDTTHGHHKWMNAIYPAVVEMKLKLKRYYAKTEHPHVYGNSIILNPRWKLSLFHQDSWEEGSVEKYRSQCRLDYMREFHSSAERCAAPEVFAGSKRNFSDMNSDDDSDDDFPQFRVNESTSKEPFNEFDHYIGMPPLSQKIRPLQYWKKESPTSPKLAMMARTYLAVSATGAGVESQFSKSGQVMRPSRGSLYHTTVTDIMLYSDHLKRHKESIKPLPGAGMTIVEDLVVVSEREAGSPGLATEVPQEWRDQWWNERGHRFSTPQG